MADLSTPVALLVFDRPELTRRVLASIVAARPPRLLVVADAPDPARPDQVERVEAVHRVIAESTAGLDVVADVADRHLGCRDRVSSGLDWVFAQCGEAIILEDDCLPDPSFFAWCDALLARHRLDERIGMITGTNDLVAWPPHVDAGGTCGPPDVVDDADGEPPHLVTRLGSVWGWASWRRAWRHYDVSMSTWDPATSTAALADLLPDERQVRYHADVFGRVACGEIDTWDHQWTWARLQHRLWTIVPGRNLVSNLGFGPAATHTTVAGDHRADLPRHRAPARPPHVEPLSPDEQFDRWWTEWQLGRPCPANVAHCARALLGAGHRARALLLLERLGRTGHLEGDDQPGAELDELRAQAIAGLSNDRHRRRPTARLAGRADYVADVRAAIDRRDELTAGWASGRLSYSHVARLRYRVLAERVGPAASEMIAEANGTTPDEVVDRLHFESRDQLGIFPADLGFYDTFDAHWIDALRELDYVGIMSRDRGPASRAILEHLQVPGRVVDHLDQEPDRSSPDVPESCFLPSLAGARLLLVAPFADLLAERADTRTFEAVWAKTGKRWFHPASVEAVTFPYGVAATTRERYATALDLLADICADIDRHDYDVALIGAAGLAVPIAAHVKRRRRVALELGGHLQIVFGVLGARWRHRADWQERYFTDAWIDMPARYRPADTGVCDGGAYW